MDPDPAAATPPRKAGPPVGAPTLLAMYETILTAAGWEQRLLRLIEQGETAGFYHAGRGQEASEVGAVAALAPDDLLSYDHRGMAHVIAKGVPLHALFADFLGRTTGTTRGLGAGIVHIASPDHGVLGQSGTLGGNFPIAAGAAMAAKMRGTGQVTLCFFGDGASNRGTFHESANAASVWRLPVVWVCQNNGWAVSVPATASTSVARIADRAPGYGMPGVTVDGQDVEAVHAAVAEAVERARSGDGPSLVETLTARMRGHYEGDPLHYRPAEVLADAKRRDPLDLVPARLLERGDATAEELETLRDRVRARVDEAAQRALADPKAGVDRIGKWLHADEVVSAWA